MSGHPAVDRSRDTRIAGVEVATATVVGATHRHRHQGCEDAVGWVDVTSGDVLAIVAVADGHSDPRCTRSAVGARFVVTAASDLAYDPAVTGEEWSTALIEGWRRLVDQDLRTRRLTVAEYDAPGGSDLRVNPRLAYGTTALLARISRDAIALAQIGDGDIVGVTAEGRAERPVPIAAGAPDLTESMSQIDADRIVRRSTIAAAASPVLLLLATDGLDNAYPTSEALPAAAAQLVTTRSSGRFDRDVLQRWVEDAAEVSGDDATLAAVWIDLSAADGGSERAGAVAPDATTVPDATTAADATTAPAR